MRSLIKSKSYKYFSKYFSKSFEEVLGETCNLMDVTLDYAINKSTTDREEFVTNFESKKRETEAEIFSAYSEVDVYIYAQLWKNRHSCYYYILDRIPKKGNFCEYGCGVGPISQWILKKRKDINITLVDIPSRTLDYCKKKYKNTKRIEILEVGFGKDGLPLKKYYDSIACLDVLEHTLNPLEIIEHIISHLKIGGYIFINHHILGKEKGPNLPEARKQQPEVRKMLNEKLKIIIPLNEIGTNIAIYMKDN